MRPAGFHHTQETKEKMILNHGRWNKGLTSKTSQCVRKQSESLKKHWKENQHPRGMLGKKHSLGTKLKMSSLRKGLQNANWKGGSTGPYTLHHNSKAWSQRRLECFKRDGFICQRCYEKLKKPHAHHIIPWRISKDDSLDNLKTLCSPCHWIGELEFRRTHHE